MIVTENNYLFDCKLNIADNTTDSLYLCADIDSSQQKKVEDFCGRTGRIQLMFSKDILRELTYQYVRNIFPSQLI